MGHFYLDTQYSWWKNIAFIYLGLNKNWTYSNGHVLVFFICYFIVDIHIDYICYYWYCFKVFMWAVLYFHMANAEYYIM